MKRIILGRIAFNLALAGGVGLQAWINYQAIVCLGSMRAALVILTTSVCLWIFMDWLRALRRRWYLEIEIPRILAYLWASALPGDREQLMRDAERKEPILCEKAMRVYQQMEAQGRVRK